RNLETAVPFLLINPDARTGGMGDAGVAAFSDRNSLFNNPSKIALNDYNNGFALSYSPRMRSLADDINLLYFSGTHRLNENTVIGSAVRYLSLGEFELTNNDDQLLDVYTPNELAVDFTYAKRFGNSFSLADQKGKYVVLDFWGSWCVPCIQGLPKMKEYYEKYKTKVEFVGIACNDLPGPWQAAVRKYNMKWTQLLDNRDIENKIASVYGIQLYPTKILINPEGIIEGVFSGEGSEFYEKLDSLISLSGL
ncbi:MAG: TlpA family protein disulfide reductase, partial [Chitinophagaceae bacterium]